MKPPEGASNWADLGSKERELLVKLARHIRLRRGFSQKTARNNVQALSHLMTLGLTAKEWLDGDRQALVEDVLDLHLEEGTNAGSYNDDIDALAHLAHATGVPVHVQKGRDDFEPYLPQDVLRMAKRKEPRNRDPVVLTPEEVAQVFSYQARDPRANLLHRGLAHWHLYAVKRPEESSMVDLGDVDRDNFRVRIRNPGKTTPVHTVDLPAHVFSRRRPWGAYLHWRINNDAEIGRHTNALFVTRRSIHQKWHRIAPLQVARIMGNSISKRTGVHVTATILRATGLSAIANDPHADVLDAKRHANHAKVDTTMHYVRREEEHHRKRITKALRDLPRGKHHDEHDEEHE